MSMMGDDAALRAVFGTYIAAPSRPEGAVYVDQSTVAPTLTTDLVHQAQAKGVSYLTAPVFGRPDAAANKQLYVVVAGEKAAKAKVQAVAEHHQALRYFAQTSLRCQGHGPWTSYAYWFCMLLLSLPHTIECCCLHVGNA